MRGFSLLEVVLSCALLIFLMAMTTLAWVKGARAWVTNSRLVARSNQVALAVRGLERELSQTSNNALVTAPGVLAFPSAYGVRGQAGQDQFHRLATQPIEPQWSKYLVYYYTAADQTLNLREVAIPTTSSAALQPLPLPDADLGSGPQALSGYASGGKVVAGRITLCEFDRQGPTLQVHLGYEESSEGGHLRKSEARSTTLLRN